MVNGDVKGVTFADAGEATDADMSTGVVVVGVKKGDDVYIRTGTYVRATMQSSKHGRASFSGWKIYWEDIQTLLFMCHCKHVFLVVNTWLYNLIVLFYIPWIHSLVLIFQW